MPIASRDELRGMVGRMVPRTAKASTVPQNQHEVNVRASLDQQVREMMRSMGVDTGTGGNTRPSGGGGGMSKEVALARLREINDLPDASRMQMASQIKRLAAVGGWTVFEDYSVAIPGTKAYRGGQ